MEDGLDIGDLSNLTSALPVPKGAKKKDNGTLGVVDDSPDVPKPGAKTSAPSKPPREGIYEFPDAKGGNVPYVGQSGNIPGRLSQHEAKGRLVPGTETTTEVLGGKTAREIAEHNRIQELTGGQKAKNSPNVTNQCDPIGPKRRPGLGLPEPRD